MNRVVGDFTADATGDNKYIDAAVLVMEWAENNVSQEDGSWTVIRNPKFSNWI